MLAATALHGPSLQHVPAAARILAVRLGAEKSEGAGEAWRRLATGRAASLSAGAALVASSLWAMPARASPRRPPPFHADLIALGPIGCRRGGV